MNWPSIIVWTAITVAVAVSGILYSWVFYGGYLQGGVYAVIVCLPIIAFERGLIFQGLRRWMVNLPTLGYLASELTFYTAIILLGFLIAGTIMWGFQTVGDPWHEAAIPHPIALIYRLLVALIIIAILRIRDLIGRQRFVNLLLGRYRTPTVEERIFLFIDLAGSTQYAEKFGDIKLMELLGALFTTIAEPVRRHAGTIDDYVGDAAIISWQMDKGLERARCIRCAIEILEIIERDGPSWKRNFGMVPKLRAALYGGPVVTAEIGSDHHKITYFGDTINTTARLESMCKDLDEQVLISTNLLERIKIPDGMEVYDHGLQAIRGRDSELAVCALRPMKTQLTRQSAGGQSKRRNYARS
jgi:adenylate cyclase